MDGHLKVEPKEVENKVLTRGSDETHRIEFHKVICFPRN